ncbi:MAG: tRNA (guanosine(37)-N1)-methyltransferase TrmD [Pseudomonadota bacterium]|jgi:tRNA (guanine37-N1)-methyltransferase|nr:tRNA (guanosine(37)-N1)-methyltransferase TrmD [Gammaproteobacteria bacterium]MEC8170572.1 tRNA (guanosine(37)-N1)-methyltransferase TrmD [Pseudomonadota bacterium]|tara:strand:- start:1724 stop:2467 length:744 start_codon:yes stop_codon:yes gene_type:complete
MRTFNFITIFPDLINNFLKYGLVNRAIEKKIIEINTIYLRDFSDDSNLRIDDKSYGGGPGMVMRYKPVEDALKSITRKSYVIYLSPHGSKLDQHKISELTKAQNLTFLCGRYEGYDQRVVDDLVDEQISLGDYVISGGELPSLILLEGITRLLPNVANDLDSILNDSFTDNLLDYPHYTRPESINGHEVPDVLLSGNHNEIAKWRRKQSLGITWKNRPDLLKNVKLSIEDDKLLKEYINESKENENK